MIAGPIQVATIAQLLSGEAGTPGSVSHVETLCQGGAYWDLTAPAGIAYSEIFGVLQSRDRAIGHNAFTVSIDGLRTILEACVADLGTTDERSWQ
jgi:hypothetical protein